MPQWSNFLALACLQVFLIDCATLTHGDTSSFIQLEKISTVNGQQAHVATIDLQKAKLSLVKPQKSGELLEVSELARRANAVVAVNAGFFGADGNPINALKIDGKWISKPHPTKLRGVVGFDDKHSLIFDRLIKKKEISNDVHNNFATPQWWDDVDNIVGGTPLLLINGKKIDPTVEETLTTFLKDRYARTAICNSKDSKVKLIVIDGGDRKSNIVTEAQGMTINELADFLLTLGCKNALNLDGGYSSTYVANGKKLNRFAIETLPERKVSSVFIVTRR